MFPQFFRSPITCFLVRFRTCQFLIKTSNVFFFWQTISLKTFENYAICVESLTHYLFLLLCKCDPVLQCVHVQFLISTPDRASVCVCVCSRLCARVVYSPANCVLQSNLREQRNNNPLFAPRDVNHGIVLGCSHFLSSKLLNKALRFAECSQVASPLHSY